ncbi:hypothetical protein SAMN05444340_12611 [Citreimonas salinaria]|uniref:Uncharacterized protein n=1 Tax=Citreimonas salinaria TaxID=321339 RepID=A0A1H3NL12_9RHOB|nr:hypothetical protein SAMN05444340_12611 [Citreimonas salinaria]
MKTKRPGPCEVPRHETSIIARRQLKYSMSTGLPVPSAVGARFDDEPMAVPHHLLSASPSSGMHFAGRAAGIGTSKPIRKARCRDNATATAPARIHFCRLASRAALFQSDPALADRLTVIGFGTSTPELLVLIDALWRGVPDITSDRPRHLSLLPSFRPSAFARTAQRTIAASSSFVRTAVLHPPKMLRDARMAALRKLRRGVETVRERQDRAVHDDVHVAACAKPNRDAVVSLGSKRSLRSEHWHHSPAPRNAKGWPRLGRLLADGSQSSRTGRVEPEGSSGLLEWISVLPWQRRSVPAETPACTPPRAG